MRFLSLAAASALTIVTAASAGFAQTASAPLPVVKGLAAQPLSRAAVHPSPAARTRYIVRFEGAPVPFHAGGRRELRTASAPRATSDRQLEMYPAPARDYANYLKSRHVEFLQHAREVLRRPVNPHFEYRYALNGMSVSLTRAEAAKLASMPNVASVTPVRYFRPTAAATAGDTAASRAWINAPAVWQTPPGLDTEGEGIVVASVDTGINFAASSFAATGPVDGYVVQNPLGSGHYLGVCDPTNTDQAAKKPGFFDCNDKLIGAYTYTSGADDPNSPEDSEGHGTHTASTIAGNLVNADLNGAEVPLSGVAPHANVISYDVCDPTNSCGTDASVKAVDQAIKDYDQLKQTPGFKGMVLNYSIGGGDFPYTDPVSRAFLSAVEAGVYVSVAGGNGGPGNTIANDDSLLYPVEHVGPWVATVAASSHDGYFANGLTLSGGATAVGPFDGTGTTSGLTAAPIVYAGDYTYPTDYDFSAHLDPDAIYGPATAPATPEEVAQAARECDFPFPPDTFTGNPIVVCDRGTIARVQKAVNVSYDWSAHSDSKYTSGTTGGAGFVLANDADLDTMYQDAYAVPGVQLDYADGAALKSWLAANPGIGGAASPTNPQNPALTAIIAGTTSGHDATQADLIAGFSSRGPTGSVYDNVLKPDFAAPGVDVLAAVSNPAYTDGVTGGANEPDTYGIENGTSMASPHDAGAAALLMQVHPAWTPSEIKSALMLTAVVAPLKDGCASLDADDYCVAGGAVPSPQVRGAGRIDVSLANRSGIIMNVSGAEFEAANPAQDGNLTQLNLPSVANNDCVLSCEWSRTFTSALDDASASYTVTVSGAPAGLDVSVSPSSFTLAPGATQAVTVTADVSALPPKQWAFAQIDVETSGMGDDGQPIPPMHLPLAVEPQPPTPTMKVSPDSLNLTVQQGGTISGTLTISDTGLGDLDWNLAKTARSSATSLWDQPYKGSINGIPSAYYAHSKHGIYAADHFSMPVAGTVTKIFADGFAQTADNQFVNLATDAVHIDWYIYKDVGGLPAGNPEDDRDDYVWHYRSEPGGSGVTTSGGQYGGGITLGVTAAGQPSIALEAGEYWLIVDVRFNAGYKDSDSPSWYWFLSKSLDKDQASNGAVLLDPGELLDQGAIAYLAGGSLAYTISGRFDCAGATNSGLTFNEQQGHIEAGESGSVKVTFDAASATPGQHVAPVCISGNDPENPVAAVPVTVQVEGAPADTASSGGGGTTGLLSLALLGLLLVERRGRR
ncbi:MAG TPA: S8 family serine peptidase [Gammaproteobacteria bacterium]|nr:S8 family serine peptidase [Gammaproteobacteria bacterium]